MKRKDHVFKSAVPALALILTLTGGAALPGTVSENPGTVPPIPELPPVEEEIPETDERDGISPLTDIDEPIHFDKA